MILPRSLRQASDMRFASGRRGQRPPSDGSFDQLATGQQKLRVMIVEDELFVAMHLESVLEEIGYEVTGILSTGERAVAEFGVLRPDVVLMDINLGAGIDGIEAAERIRAAGAAHIIFVSAYSDLATRARIEAALPGSRILSKPVTPAGLKGAIEAQTHQRH